MLETVDTKLVWTSEYTYIEKKFYLSLNVTDMNVDEGILHQEM